MGHKQAKLEKSFIDQQQARLLSLRAELIAAAGDKADEAAALGAEAASDTHDSEDDAQKMAILEVDSNLVAHDQQRLAQVDRALQKIEDGTYGQSDASGDPIPRERLEVMPEALLTVAEQDARER